MQLIDKTLLTK